MGVACESTRQDSDSGFGGAIGGTIGASFDIGKVILEAQAREAVADGEVSYAMWWKELRARGLMDDRLAVGIGIDALIEHEDHDGVVHLSTDGEQLLAAATSAVLMNSSLTSTLKVSTTDAGAVIKYRLIAREDEYTCARLTNETEEVVPVGLYHIWSERNGVATSSQTNQYRVIEEMKAVVLKEELASN